MYMRYLNMAREISLLQDQNHRKKEIAQVAPKLVWYSVRLS